jgi:hypothetical protein
MANQVLLAAITRTSWEQKAVRACAALKAVFQFEAQASRTEAPQTDQPWLDGQLDHPTFRVDRAHLLPPSCRPQL